MEHKGFQELVADAKKKITEISPADAVAKAKSSDAVIVDVRDKDEFDESHIPDAVHMSRGLLEFEIEEKFPDRNMTIICHCGGGGRSALAAESLQKMGTKTSAPWPAALKPGKPPNCQRRNSFLSADGLVMAEAAVPHGARDRPGEKEPAGLNGKRLPKLCAF